MAIVDYGMGNLFSVAQACDQVGLGAAITSSPQEIIEADAVILPGVGAFGDAMETLSRLDLVSVLRDLAASPTPLVGICLGMQLLMTESHEFGRHRGMGIIEGEVLHLEVSTEAARTLKVPQVGWNRIYPVASTTSPEAGESIWIDPILDGLAGGEYMYFVHSFYPEPVDSEVIVSTTNYGATQFCSSLRQGSVYACQFHPERSGSAGLRLYRNLARIISAQQPEELDA